MKANNPHLTLFELNQLVRELIETEMPHEYWVEAEISELREVGGHCYMDLIQKDIYNNTPVAKASARCWRSSWNGIKARFIRVTQKTPRQGMKMLLKVSAQFHENYGFSWIVSDIDPTFTLGDMAAKRQQILRQLEAEGVINANKELPLPLFTQRIAVISSATAAGYGDFCKHLSENEHGYVFQTQLFEAVMQGEGVEQSIIAAINRIEDQTAPFDCIVITRGGGATSDLSGFDALDLARKIAYCSLPVITAIGHDRDESVLDIISNTRLKTPTAAAAFFIDRLREVEIRIDDAHQRILRAVEESLADGFVVAEVTMGLCIEEAVNEALPDVIDGLFGRVEHIFCIEAVVAQFVELDFVGREVAYLLRAFLLHGFHSQQQCGLRQSALVETILGIAVGGDRQNNLRFWEELADALQDGGHLFHGQVSLLELSLRALVAVADHHPLTLIVVVGSQGDDDDVRFPFEQAASSRKESCFAGFQRGCVLGTVCEPTVPAVVFVLKIEWGISGVLRQHLQDAERVV